MLCKYCKKEGKLARGVDNCHAVGCNKYKNMYYEFCLECAEKTNRCECCGGLLKEPPLMPEPPKLTIVKNGKVIK